MCMLKSFYSDESNDIETALINYDTTTVVNKIKEKYVEFWRHKTTNSSKLSFLCTFKKDYKMEPYLYLIKNPTIRRTFTQFRMGNDKTRTPGPWPDYLCGPGPWTTFVDHSHGPFSWTTRETPDFGGLHDLILDCAWKN